MMLPDSPSASARPAPPAAGPAAACRLCRFWSADGTDMATGAPIGDCRRHAPTLTRGMAWRSVGPSGGHDEDNAVWPMTYGDDSCGEFASAAHDMGDPSPPVEFKGQGPG